MGRPIKIAKAHAVITLTETNAATNVVTTTANLNSLGVLPGMTFIPSADMGGMISGETYFILNILSDNTFTVSETSLSANSEKVVFDLSATTAQTVSATIAPVNLGFNNPEGLANTFAVVGGDVRIHGNQVLTNVCIGQSALGTITVSDDSTVVTGVDTVFGAFSDGTILYTTEGDILGTITDTANATQTTATFAANSTATLTDAEFVFGLPEDGFIVRQKGKQKYLVKGTSTGLLGSCFTVDLDSTELLANTMSITATFANATTQRVQSLSNRNVTLFTADPAVATFNTALEADADAGIPYPIVTIGKE